MSRLVALSVAGERRATLLASACAALGLELEILDWSRWLAGEHHLGEHLVAGDVLRIDSPGEDREAVLRIVALGAPALGQDPEAILAQGQTFGRFHRLRMRHEGLRACLARVDRERPAGTWMLNDSEAILAMGDKLEAHRRMIAAGVSTTPLLGQVDPGQGLEALRAIVESSTMAERVFIKPRFGSSAAGVVALDCSGAVPHAITSARLVEEGDGDRVYNSLRLSHYHSWSEIARLLEVLAHEGLVVERWLTKDRLGGQRYDLRIVVVDGRASHRVARTSDSPMTNLHLGNARGDIDALRAQLGSEGLAALDQAAEEALAAFAPAFYAGVDVLRSEERAAVVEINAFGDLLPGVTDARGDDVWTHQARRILARPARS